MTLVQWLSGFSALETTCQHCGAKLVATQSTYIGFALALGALFVAFGLTQWVLPDSIYPEFKLAAALPVAFGGPLLAWLLSGYRQD